jgi:hypothetical protein
MSYFIGFTFLLIVCIFWIIFSSIKVKHIKIPPTFWPIYYFTLLFGSVTPYRLSVESIIPKSGYQDVLIYVSELLLSTAFLIGGLNLLFRKNIIWYGIINSEIAVLFPSIGNEKDKKLFIQIGIFMTIIGSLGLLIIAIKTLSWIVELLAINGIVT